MKYLAQVNVAAGGCYRFNSDSLDAIRDFAKTVGQKGDVLTILRNGDQLKNARTITI